MNEYEDYTTYRLCCNKLLGIDLKYLASSFNYHPIHLLSLFLEQNPTTMNVEMNS